MEKSKKRILLINSHFKTGGVETALVNMANELSKKYDVDLFIYNPVGPMEEQLADNVRIIPACKAIRTMGMTLNETIKSKNIFMILFRLFGSIWSKFFTNKIPIWIAIKLQKKIKGYDLAISFRQEAYKNVMDSGYTRVLDRCVEAKCKAIWIHYDSINFNNDIDFNVKYYKKADKIVCVSKSVQEAFNEVNPELAHKTEYCYNFFDYDEILKRSEEQQDTKYPENKFVCFSACRLSRGKAIARGVSAFAQTLREHKDIVWYIAGDGPERKNIEAAIKKEGLEDRIILLGNQINPYPYMKNADLLLLISYFEAAPMVYNEAKILHVPIFSTETSSTREMVMDGMEGFICENSENGLSEVFSEIMNNREKIEKVRENLKRYSASNDDSLAKIEDMLQ